MVIATNNRYTWNWLACPMNVTPRHSSRGMMLLQACLISVTRRPSGAPRLQSTCAFNYTSAHVDDSYNRNGLFAMITYSFQCF